MAALTNIVKISKEDYETLKTQGYIIKDDIRYNYDENAMYCVPDEGGNVLSAGDNIEIDDDNNINALGYAYNIDGNQSFSEGYNSTASGNYSHAEGYHTIANADYQHVQGKYNLEDSNQAFIIGWGTGNSPSTRKNIFTVDTVGNVNAKGNITENGTLLSNKYMTKQPSSIEFIPSTTTSNNGGYLDFHYNKSIDDYTSRIIELTPGILTFYKSNGSGYANLKAGNVNATAFYEGSDERLKNIHGELDLDKAYDLINKCSTILYDLKDDESHKTQVGVIAQEIQEFFPEIVTEDKDGMLSVDYSRLTVIIMRVLKDLIEEVKKLKEKL